MLKERNDAGHVVVPIPTVEPVNPKVEAFDALCLALTNQWVSGKWVHVGRVNSKRRIEYFSRLGVDSIDGSGFSKWADARIPLAVKWIDRVMKRKQTVMFGGNC